MSEIALWGAGTARTLRPIWVAEELGIPYQLHPIGPRTGETRTAEYTRLNRKQKIPLMQRGALLLSESLAICRYLIGAFPGAALVSPTDAAGRAKEDEWCCYIYGELDETALYVMRRHYDLTEIYGEAPKAVQVCREYLRRHFEVIDAHLAKADTVLPGGFGLADIMLVSCLDWALFYGMELPPPMAAYRKRIAQRPAYQKAMDINYAALRAMAKRAAAKKKANDGAA